MELAEIMDDFRKDIAWHNEKTDAAKDGDSKRRHQLRAARLQKHLITLQAVMRRLELTNDITMNFIAEDICEKILQVRKDPMADRYVGVIVYYEFKPRWQWREDGMNPVACVSSVPNWPYGDYMMTDRGDGRFTVDSDRPAPGCWVLGGQYIPLQVPVVSQKGEGSRL